MVQFARVGGFFARSEEKKNLDLGREFLAQDLLLLAKLMKILKNRSLLFQIGTGLLLGVGGIAFVEIFWPSIKHAPYSVLVLSVLGAYVLGGGLVSGIVTSAVLMAYALKLVSYTGWLPYFIFLNAAILVALVVKNTQKKIKTLSESQIRAEESTRLKFAASAGKLGIWEWDVHQDKML